MDSWFHGPYAISHQPSWLLAGCGALGGGRLQRQLLHAPVEQLGDVELVLARAGDLVNPAELLRLVSRLAEPPEHLAVERQLVDAAGERVAAVQELLAGCVRRRDADGPRRALRDRGPS